MKQINVVLMGMVFSTLLGSGCWKTFDSTDCDDAAGEDGFVESGESRCSGSVVRQCVDGDWSDRGDCAALGMFCVDVNGEAHCAPADPGAASNEAGAADVEEGASTGNDIPMLKNIDVAQCGRDALSSIGLHEYHCIADFEEGLLQAGRDDEFSNFFYPYDVKVSRGEPVSPPVEAHILLTVTDEVEACSNHVMCVTTKSNNPKPAAVGVAMAWGRPEDTTPTPIDLGFEGFSFWAMRRGGEAKVNVMFPDTHTSAIGGTCNNASTLTACNNHWSTAFNMEEIGVWKQYYLSFADLDTDPTWGYRTSTWFRWKEYGVLFQSEGDVDYCIDDVSLVGIYHGSFSR